MEELCFWGKSTFEFFAKSFVGRHTATKEDSRAASLFHGSQCFCGEDIHYGCLKGSRYVKAFGIKRT